MSENVQIVGSRSLRYTSRASELERTMPLVVLFAGGVFMVALFIGMVPAEVSGYFLSAGFALTFYGLFYMLRFPAGRRLKGVP